MFNCWRKLTELDPVLTWSPLWAALPLCPRPPGTASFQSQHLQQPWGGLWMGMGGRGVKTSPSSIWDTIRTQAGNIPLLPVLAWPQHSCFVAGILLDWGWRLAFTGSQTLADQPFNSCPWASHLTNLALGDKEKKKEG